MLSTPLLTSSAPPLRRGGEREDILHPPLSGGHGWDTLTISTPPDKINPTSPPDKGGKGGLNNLIVLKYVFYVNILFIK